jgi:hypothetical protein
MPVRSGRGYERRSDNGVWSKFPDELVLVHGSKGSLDSVARPQADALLRSR